MPLESCPNSSFRPVICFLPTISSINANIPMMAIRYFPGTGKKSTKIINGANPTALGVPPLMLV